MDEATNVIERPPEADETGGRAADRAAGRVAGGASTYNPAIDGIRGVAVGVVLLFHAGLPLGSRRLPRRLDVLHAVGVPHHVAAARRAQRHRRHLPRGVLGAADAAAAARLGGHARGGGHRLAGVRRPAAPRACRATSSPRCCRWPTGGSCSTTSRYADLFATPSPVLHFWSLAIEEQFYWLFPLLTAVVFAVGRGSVKVYAAVLAALLAVSAVATAMLGVQREHHRLLRHLHPHGRDPGRVAAGGGRVARR